MKPAHAQAWTPAGICLRFAVALCLVLGSASTRAHSIVMESNPGVNATVSGGIVNIDLRFNSRIDKQRSRLRISGPKQLSLPLTIDESPAADRLISHTSELAPGDYRLEWQVLGADGHITRGFIPFKLAAKAE